MWLACETRAKTSAEDLEARIAALVELVAVELAAEYVARMEAAAAAEVNARHQNEEDPS